MADQLDNRPVFTIVMGCNGAGKSAWKRSSYDILPDRYFDQDSVAGGIGDWNSADARERTAEIVNAGVEKAILERVSYGIESTYSGRPGRERVAQAIQAGYRIEGLYIGTRSPEINIQRVALRVRENTGHYVDPKIIPERYKYSLSNLRRTVDLFDQLVVFDNSRVSPLSVLNPVEQCCLEFGRIVSRINDGEIMSWCRNWLDSVEQSLAERERIARKEERGEVHKRKKKTTGTS